MALYTRNEEEDEELEILTASLNNLRIFSVVIDKLEIMKKAVPIASLDEIEIEWFRFQEELADCFLLLKAVENIDNSDPVRDAKESLMEEVVSLKKIVDEVCPHIRRPVSKINIGMLDSDQLAVIAPEYEEDTGQREQTGQTESESGSMDMSCDSVWEKHDYESSSAEFCERDSYRMDILIKPPKRSIDLKNSVRCRRGKRVCEIEGRHSDLNDHSTESESRSRDMSYTESESESRSREMGSTESESESRSCDMSYTESESRSRDMSSDLVGDSPDEFSCEREGVNELITAGELEARGEINGVLVEIPKNYCDRYKRKKKGRRDKFFAMFGKWFCGTTYEYVKDKRKKK